ncbi:peptidoglycan recognition protein family protein [Herbihabitans rhizosphaerae]|uniref:peptidoglycan recognition protein family protein n=1 Tax=Herbihabitans rhizosphaerae TaxID=1872711 RepID=UPI0013EED068|nr:N-acetylmuramoyl-L-alanine amidase [Herbihabitans rhizosphaerae]
MREVPGWQSRGHGELGDLRAVLLHHTAGPASGNYPSEGTVVNGRPGLDGPLAQLGLARDGTWVIVAAGQAWHAGNGAHPGIPTNAGNRHMLGVEAESTGRGDWTPAQLDAYPRGVAAILRHLRLGADRAIAHKEWAAPRGRKIDPAGWPGDMAGFRAAVAHHLRGAAPAPTPAPISDPYEECTMPVPAGTDDHVVVPAAGRPPFLYVFAAYGRSVQARLEFVGPTPSAVADPNAKRFTGPGQTITFHADRPGPVRIPDGTVGVVIRYTADHSFTAFVG